MPEGLLTRSVNVEFSGGEKKAQRYFANGGTGTGLCIDGRTPGWMMTRKSGCNGVNSLRDGVRHRVRTTNILDFEA